MADISFLDLIEIILLLISAIVILIASIKLFMNKDIPRSKLFLVAFIGSVIGALLLLIETFYVVVDNYIFISIVNVYLATMLLVGSYGFWCLARYSIKQSANK